MAWLDARLCAGGSLQCPAPSSSLSTFWVWAVCLFGAILDWDYCVCSVWLADAPNTFSLSSSFTAPLVTPPGSVIVCSPGLYIWIWFFSFLFLIYSPPTVWMDAIVHGWDSPDPDCSVHPSFWTLSTSFINSVNELLKPVNERLKSVNELAVPLPG